jgi:hypothetical protein
MDAVVLVRQALVRHLLMAEAMTRAVLVGLAILWGLLILNKAVVIGSKGAPAVTVRLFVTHRTILLLAVASNPLTHKLLLLLFQPESWIPLHLEGMRLWIASRKVAVHVQAAEVDGQYIPCTSFMLHDIIFFTL